MKVKIGEAWYSTEDVPIMILLNDLDKANLRDMPEGMTRYCGYPEGHDPEVIREWMMEDMKREPL